MLKNYIIYELYLSIILFLMCNLMGIGDWGLGIGDWGLGPIPTPQSPIPNPQTPIPKQQSPIPNPQSPIPNLIMNKECELRIIVLMQATFNKAEFPSIMGNGEWGLGNEHWGRGKM